MNASSQKALMTESDTSSSSKLWTQKTKSLFASNFSDHKQRGGNQIICLFFYAVLNAFSSYQLLVSCEQSAINSVIYFFQSPGRFVIVFGSMPADPEHVCSATWWLSAYMATVLATQVLLSWPKQRSSLPFLQVAQNTNISLMVAATWDC